MNEISQANLNSLFDLNTIQQIVVDDECLETVPCMHGCTVTLKSGVMKEDTFSAPEILELTSLINKERIKMKNGMLLNHFDSWKDLQRMTLIQASLHQLFNEQGE